MDSIFHKYKHFLPLDGTGSLDGLGEGNTPLVKSLAIADEVGSRNLFFKSEHVNPTGSFKDRFAALEVALMKQSGIKACIATSSGNTGSALAAYTARYGIKCHIFINEVTPVNKLNQMLVYGAKLFRVEGFGVSEEKSRFVFQRLHEMAEECNTRFIVSAYEYSPAGMEGVKTIAYELVEQLDGPPDYVFVPVGGGGMLTAIWRGFVDLRRRSLIPHLPRMIAVQPELNDTVVTPLLNGAGKARAVKTTTSVSGLAVQVDIDATRALKAVKESQGWGVLVPDEEVLEAQKQLCLREGLYIEPAGAVSVAGFLRAVAQHRMGGTEKVVCILSGHGFKDPVSTGLIAAESEIEDVDLAALKMSLIGCA